MADLNYRPAAEIEFTQPEPTAPRGDSLQFEQTLSISTAFNANWNSLT